MKIEKYKTKENLLPVIVTKSETLLGIADPYTKLQVQFDTNTKQVVGIVTPWKDGFEPLRVDMHLYHIYDRILRGMRHPREHNQYLEYTKAMQNLCNEQGAKLVGNGDSANISGTIVSNGKVYTIQSPHNN